MVENLRIFKHRSTINISPAGLAEGINKQGLRPKPRLRVRSTLKNPIASHYLAALNLRKSFT